MIYFSMSLTPMLGGQDIKPGAFHPVQKLMKAAVLETDGAVFSQQRSSPSWQAR